MTTNKISNSNKIQLKNIKFLCTINLNRHIKLLEKVFKIALKTFTHSNIKYKNMSHDKMLKFKWTTVKKIFISIEFLIDL